jgi:GntR family transcriptional regulator
MPTAETFPYRRIVEDLESEILTSKRGPGERLPSEHELASRYNTSRPTVRRAIAQLRSRGLVVTEQGRGAFVRPQSHVRLLLSGTSYRRHRTAGLTGFNAQVVEQGQVPEQQLVEVATIEASSEVAMRLDLDDSADVVVRRRRFLVDGQPIALCDSYYPAEFVAGTAIADHRRVRGGVHALIEDPEGPIKRRVARSVDDLKARMPRQHEADSLELPPGVPVVEIIRTVYDTDDRPLEVQVSVAAADRHEFRYEVSMT